MTIWCFLPQVFPIIFCLTPNWWLDGVLTKGCPSWRLLGRHLGGRCHLLCRWHLDQKKWKIREESKILVWEIRNKETFRKKPYVIVKLYIYISISQETRVNELSFSLLPRFCPSHPHTPSMCASAMASHGLKRWNSEPKIGETLWVGQFDKAR